MIAAVPAGARRASIPQTIVSSVTTDADGEVARAALSFPATHAAFSWTGDEDTGVRYRTINAEGRATPWRAAPEAQDMEHGRHHYSGVISLDRPEVIEWIAVRPSTARVGTVTLDYLNTVDGPRVSLARSPDSETRHTPEIVTRAQWGADESIKRDTGDCTRAFYRVQQLFVHHTAGSNYDSHPEATMRAIYWYHTVRRGWCDIGYNFVIGWDGRIYEGRWARRYRPWEAHTNEDRRGRAVRGAHVKEFNSGSVGVSLMGNFSTVPVPARMRRALRQFLAWEADRHNLPPQGTHIYRNPETGLRRKLPFIAGHLHAGQTACPGGNVYRRLPSIRRAVLRTIGAGRFNTRVRLQSPTQEIPYGSATRVRGRLARRSGAGMPGREIAVYTRAGLAPWRRASVVTGTDGRFSARLAPAANAAAVAVWRGGSRSWGSQSVTRRIAVQPHVSLVAEGVEAGADGVYRYPAGTTEVTLAGEVRPPHPGRPVRVEIAEVPSDGGAITRGVPLAPDSRYSYTFTRPQAGATYRAATRIAEHRDHAPGTSPSIAFTIEEP